MNHTGCRNISAPSSSLLRFLKSQSEAHCLLLRNVRNPHCFNPTKSAASTIIPRNSDSPCKFRRVPTLHPSGVLNLPNKSLTRHTLRKLPNRTFHLNSARVTLPRTRRKLNLSFVRYASTESPPWYSQIFGFGGNKTKTKLKADDLPPLPGYLDEGPETLLGRSVLGKASNEVKLRCTEFDEHGNVTLVNGEFKKSELIAKYGLLPRDLRKIDSALLPHILVRPSAILINLLHLRVLIKSDHVLVFDTYGSTDSYTQSVFMYDLEGKLRQREGSRQAGGLPYEFRALEAVLISVTTGLEAEFEGVREPVVRVLRALEEDIDRDKLRHLLIYSKKLGTFEQRAKLVRDAIDELLDADDDLAAMYLTEKAKGDGRGEADHTEVEMLLESYHKVCDEIVQVSGNLVSNIRNTEEIVKAILDANRNSLMLLDLKFSIGTLGIGSGAFIAALYGMNLKNFMEESDLGFIGVTGCSFAFALVVCMYGLTKLRKVQRVSMWGEEGVGMVGQGRRNWRSVDDGMPTGRADRLRRLRDSRSDALLDRGSHCAGADAAEGLPPLLSEKVRVGDLPFTRKNKAL